MIKQTREERVNVPLLQNEYYRLKTKQSFVPLV